MPSTGARIVGRILAGVVAIIGALVCLIATAIIVLTNSSWGHSQVQHIALNAMRGPVHGIVTIGGIGGDLLTHLVVTDLAITDSTGAPFIRLRRAEVRYRLIDLLKERLAFTDVHVDHPVIVLAESQDGVWNYRRIFPSSGAASSSNSGFGSDVSLAGVYLTNGELTVRMPWRPDSTLRGAARDSAIALATSPTSRSAVGAVSDGFEKSIAVHGLALSAPSVRLADPTSPVKVFEIATLRGDFALFRPPDALVYDLAGTFRLDADSLWWNDARIRLPSSHLTAAGAYQLASGDVHAAVHAQSAALRDLRFLDPQVPEAGELSANVSLTQREKHQDFMVRDLLVQSGAAHANGTVGLSIGDSIAFHSTQLQFAGIDTRLVEQLAPALKIPRRGTISGHGTLAGPLSGLTVDADVTYDDSAAGPSRVMARGELGIGSGFAARQLTITLAPLQVALASSPERQLPIGGTISGQAILDGSTQQAMQGHVDLVHREGGALTHVIASGDVAFAPAVSPAAADLSRSVAVGHRRGNQSEGKFQPERMNVTADFRPVDLTVVDKFVPAAQLYGSAEGGIRVSGNMNDLIVHGRLGIVNAPDSSGLTLDGHLRLSDTVPGYDLTLGAHIFDARAVSKIGPPTSLTATITATGEGVHPATMIATVAAHVRASQIDSVTVDTMALRAHVRDGQLTIDTAHVHALATTADVSGSFGLDSSRSGTVAYRIVVDSLHAWQRFLPKDTTTVALRGAALAEATARARADSARRADSTEIQRAIQGTPEPTLVVDTPRGIARGTLAGRAIATGTVSGNISRFDLHGSLAADSIIAMGNETRHAHLLYQWIGGPSRSAPLAVTVALDSAILGGFSLDSINTRITYEQPGGTARVVVLQDSAHLYSLQGRFRVTSTDKQLQYDSLSLRLDTTFWRAPHPGSITWSTTGLVVHQVELTDDRTGHIAIDGTLPVDGDTSGHLSIQLRRVHAGNLASLAQLAQPVDGEVSMEADISGTLEKPQFHGTASLSSASVRNVPMPNVFTEYAYDTTTLVTHVELAPKGAPAAPFAIMDATVPINLASNATGSRLLDRPLSGELKMDSLPLDVVSQFENDVTNLAGRVSGHITLEGTTSSPKPLGMLAVVEGAGRVTATGMSVNDVDASLKLTRDSVVIDSLTATTPSTGGTFRLSGTLDRSEPNVPVVNAELAAKDLRVLDTRDRGRLDVDAKLTIAGPTKAPYVYGSTTVLGGVFYLAPSTGKDLVDLSQPVVYHVVDTTHPAVRQLLPASESLFSRLLMDVEFSVSRGTWVRNEDANVGAYTDEPLSLHIDHGHQALVVNGTVNSDIGEYRFLGKRFTVTKGIATLIGSTTINPTLSANAQYTVPASGSEALAIVLTITGNIDSLHLALSSNHQPPLPQSDLIEYLAFGSTLNGLAQGSSSSSLTSTSSGGALGSAGVFIGNQLAAQAVGVLVNQFKGDLARALDADVLDISVANNYVDIAQNRNNAAQQFIQNTQLEFGKYLTPRTYVSLQASVAPGAAVIHRITPSLSMQLTGTSLYLLGQPTLATDQSYPLTGVLGLSLTKTWKF